jgi:trehalose synthase
MRVTLIFASVAALCGGCHSSPTPAPAPAPQAADDTAWLKEQSMLHLAAVQARTISGQAGQWRHAYAVPQPRRAAAMAPVWFTAYPAATITPAGKTLLATLGDAELWQVFADIGIRAIHTGPMKRSGGVSGRTFTPTVDGYFDRISQEIDPVFGTEDEYRAMVKTAGDHQAVVIGDIIPGHTGKGADFRLAERNVGDYPGIYHMVEIPEADWNLLPTVPPGQDAKNLSEAEEAALQAKGYIIGKMGRVIFQEPGVKDTNWSATAPVKGDDGRTRRWVYLHYFKQGQPTLNWLDPSFAAPRLLAGDLVHSMERLGERMVRLDANGFLGIEPREGAPAWSEGHPLSLTANALLSGLARKLGGFSFQELNLTLEDIREMSRSGADLSYDFVTRPAYHHALATGDTAFLRLMLALSRQSDIDPASLVHALQNHDELTLELMHFAAHGEQRFAYKGVDTPGAKLRDAVIGEAKAKLSGENAPYNLAAGNGVSCTTASVITASLGLKDISNISPADVARVTQAHLLLVAYNAFQPGVFALSGWDLVGALPLAPASIKDLLADGDTRWINRGAYDLMGKNPTAERSGSGLPRAVALYGPLPAQLARPDSFASRLKQMLTLRARYRVHEALLVEVLGGSSPGLLVMVNRLPEGQGALLSVLNFGQTPIDEAVKLTSFGSADTAQELLGGRALGKVSGGRLPLKLAPHEAQVILLERVGWR